MKKKINFSGGINIAMKLPPQYFEKTVTFYSDIIGLEKIKEEENSISFKFGSNVLWLDRVSHLTQAEIWLELITNNAKSAAEYLKENYVTRSDEVEKLPEKFKGFWISNPADIIHLICEKGE